jgi:hypothetical protein
MLCEGAARRVGVCADFPTSTPLLRFSENAVGEGENASGHIDRSDVMFHRISPKRSILRE